MFEFNYDSKINFIDGFLISIGFIFFLSEVLAGVIRYYFYTLGISYCVYLPKLFLIFSVFTVTFRGFFKKKLGRPFALLFWVLVYSFLIANFYIRNVLQMLFGLWVIVPFVYGVLIGPIVIKNLNGFRKYILFLWIIAVTGIFANLFYKWPWIGFSYEIANITVEGTREWFTGGFERLPGFARISAAAAGQILMLGLLLIFSYKSSLVKTFIWLATGVAILLTTTKTTVGIWIILTILFLFSKTPLFKFLRFLPFLLSLVVIMLPFSTLIIDYNLNIQSFYTHLLLASFEERLTFTWPWTINMVLHHGSFISGRGIGGIGASQAYFEKQLYSPADNLSLYLFGLFGVFGLTMLIVIGLLITLNIDNTKLGRLIFYLAIACFLEGLSLNVVEEPFFATCLGVVFWAAFHKPYKRKF